MNDPYYSKWRDPYIFFLDEGFDCDDAFKALTAEGYAVHRHQQHFCDPSTGKRIESIEDPDVMHCANKLRCVIVTTDAAMIDRHRSTFDKCSHLGVIATAHNSVEDIEEWISPLIAVIGYLGKNSSKKKLRPWAIFFNRQGKITARRGIAAFAKAGGAA